MSPLLLSSSLSLLHCWSSSSSSSSSLPLLLPLLLVDDVTVAVDAGGLLSLLLSTLGVVAIAVNTGGGVGMGAVIVAVDAGGGDGVVVIAVDAGAEGGGCRHHGQRGGGGAHRH